MSLVVTVYVQEGIVMAADSRLTLTSHEEQGDKTVVNLAVGQSDSNYKLFLAPHGVGISTCGDADIKGVPPTVGSGCVLFDWGDTLMVDFPDCLGPMSEWPHVEAVAHARETLEVLRSRGWRLALATNAADSDEAEIRAALARVGLDGLMDRVYCSREVGDSKPSPGFFAFIVNDLGLQSSEIVMVGDNYEVDVVGANRAGIRAVWLCRDGSAVPVDGMQRAIRDFAQLAGVLEAWSSTV